MAEPAPIPTAPPDAIGAPPRRAAVPGVRRVVVLGSTGSIGRQTLDVIAHLNGLHRLGLHPVRYEVVGLAAGRNAERLAQQAGAWPDAALALADGDPGDAPASTLRGPDAALGLVESAPCDLVVAAVVGAAGLPATLRAVELGRDIALANKETLVAAGSVVMAAAERSGSRLLPVDSEHSGVWQAMMSVCGPGYAPPGRAPGRVRRTILTASGGAFRDRSRDEVSNATPEQALEHPTWSMGAKVTIDSATLMNKALELIEAHWLFGLGSERLGVLIHRQSAVHAIVEMIDGSLLAQLGSPDMRLPIQLALTAPDLAERPAADTLSLARLGRLDFAEVDPARFPAVDLARHVMTTGGSSGAVFNAANEVAVEEFLAGRIPFGRVDEITAEVVEQLPSGPVSSLEGVLAADAEARATARQRIDAT